MKFFHHFDTGPNGVFAGIGSHNPFDELASQVKGVSGFLHNYVNERNRMARDVFMKGCCGHFYLCMQEIFRDELGYDVKPLYAVGFDGYRFSYGHVVARIEKDGQVLYVDGSGIVEVLKPENEDRLKANKRINYVEELPSGEFTMRSEGVHYEAKIDSDEFAKDMSANYMSKIWSMRQHRMSDEDRRMRNFMDENKMYKPEVATAYDVMQNIEMRQALLGKFEESGIGGFEESMEK